MIDKIRKGIKTNFFGKNQVIDRTIISLISGGHLLIEDVPGVGKTTLAKNLANSINCSFSRIQFTPDLLPTDITGVSIYNKAENKFKFNKGPVFNNIILADEINRASPKTQAALLEVMSERQVTIEGHTYKLEDPFMVIATQNPVEFEGTFPLPEAQIDRFMMKIDIGYPSKNDELKILNNYFEKPIDIKVSKEDLIKIKEEIMDVYIQEELKNYIIDLVRMTRQSPKVELGCSPRATKHLFIISKANAFLNDRDYVVPEDITAHIKETLAHRIILKSEILFKGMTNREFIDEIVNSIPIPKINE